MKSKAKEVALFCIVAVSIAACQAQPLVATWVPEKGTETLARSLFLTDDLLVFQRCNNTTFHCQTTVLKLTARGLEKITSGAFEGIAYVDSHSFYIPIWGKREPGTPQLMTRIDAISLKAAGVIPKPNLTSPSGNTFLVEEIQLPLNHNVAWKLYRMDSPVQPTFMRVVEGSPWALSDNQVVVRGKDSVIIETIDGSRISSFPMPKGEQAYFVLDEKRLLSVGKKKVSVVDLHGNEIRQVSLYPYTHNLSFSRDGNRVLWKGLVRNRNGLQLAWDVIRLLPTLTVYEYDATAMATRVVDTQTGGICLEQVYQGKDFLKTDTSLSPSGKLVALFQTGALSIYTLPDVCSVKPQRLTHLPCCSDTL